MKIVAAIFFGIILTVGVGIGAYQSVMQLKNLPINSIKTVREAISHHDLETFNKFVDTDKILADAAEEIITAQINSETNSTTYSMQDMQNIYETRKADFIPSTKSALENYVSMGKIKIPENPTQYQKWMKNSEITACSIQYISKPVINENSARSKIEFYNNELKFSFELEINLEKIDNTWKIVGAKGFENYLFGLNRALKRKLESMNRPIREEISEIFIMKGFDAQVIEGDSYGFSKTMRLAIKADVKSEKPLSKIIGRITIDGRDGKEGVTPFEIDMAYHPQGLQTFTVDKILNPFVREDADIMRHGLRKSAIHIEITEVQYLDGKSLKQHDSL